MDNARQYHIIAAGSLLGVAMHEGTSFPVGKVDFMDLYPLNFKEFLLAIGEENLKAKSLKEFVTKYETTKNIRTSMKDYKQEEWLTNIPLYSIGEIENII